MKVSAVQNTKYKRNDDVFYEVKYVIYIYQTNKKTKEEMSEGQRNESLRCMKEGNCA